MFKRLKSGLGVMAGLAALALGGSAIASAAGGTAHTAPGPAKAEVTAPRDADTTQSGNQTGPDQSAVKEGVDRAGGQDATDPQGSETSGREITGPSDGLGGHADEPGNPNANTQQSGQH
ncbi:MAG TPA: hypothetical protein VFN55_11810 [Solirubrobacteraceae bacterium]|nr:hypothetical protein [Solirubrobacteraceae bacterium]